MTKEELVAYAHANKVDGVNMAHEQGRHDPTS